MRENLAIIAAAGLLILGGCSKAKEPGRHYDDKNNFSIKFPSDWEVISESAGTSVLGRRPRTLQDTFVENVNVVAESCGRMSLDDYHQANLKSLRTMIQGFGLEATETVTINGKQARKLTWRHQTGKMQLKVMSYLFVSGGRGYVVTCTATENSFNKWKQVLSNVAETFRIE